MKISDQSINYKVDLSVIIVNFKTSEVTVECVESLKKHLTCNYEIIVVDNNSQDNSKKHITNLHQDISWIQLDKNMGYGYAINQGSKNSKGKYLLVLNSDIIILSDFFGDIKKKYCELNAGSIGIKLILPNTKTQNTVSTFPRIINILGDDIRWIRKIKKFSRYSMSLSLKSDLHKVDWLTGAFMFFSKLNFQKAEGFDDRFFMYYEDVDLCKKLSDNSTANYYYTAHSAIHKHCYSVNTQKLPFNKYKIINRKSAIYYISKYHHKYLKCYKSLLFSIHLLKFFKNIFLTIISFWIPRKRSKFLYGFKTNQKMMEMITQNENKK